MKNAMAVQPEDHCQHYYYNAELSKINDKAGYQNQYPSYLVMNLYAGKDVNNSSDD